MKIALITDDEKTISEHFGRAGKYLVFTVQENKIVHSETRNKVGHNDFVKLEVEGGHEHHEDPRGRGFGNHSEEKHQKMFEAIKDCNVLVVRGMGRGAYLGLEKLGIKPIVSDIEEIELAVESVIKGTIINHIEKLH